MLRRMMGNKNYTITITTNGYEHSNIGIYINEIEIIYRVPYNSTLEIRYKKGDNISIRDNGGYESTVTVDGVDHDISYNGSYTFKATGLHAINIESWGMHSGGGAN